MCYRTPAGSLQQLANLSLEWSAYSQITLLYPSTVGLLAHSQEELFAWAGEEPVRAVRWLKEMSTQASEAPL